MAKVQIRICGVPARQGHFRRQFIRSNAGFRASHIGHPTDPDAPLPASCDAIIDID
jgi:hypothetical protein